MRRIAWSACVGALCLGVGMVARGGDGKAAGSAGALELPADPKNYAPIERYEAMAIPPENPITAEKATLGWQLYYDKRLSGDGSRACYSCHVNEHGLTDGKALGEGAFGKKLTRSAPTLWNIGYHHEWYWDGRAKTLEGQALAAWKLANMGGKDKEKDEVRADIIAALNAVPEYKEQFQNVFGGPATQENVAKALATYMRTIVSRATAFDRWQRGDEKAASDAAKRGYKVFQKAKCDNCHSGVLFTDLQYHNVGIGMKAEKPDLGRGAVTKNEKDAGAFKTPTLRDVARSGPYFHDGSAADIKDALERMVVGGIDNPNLDRANLKPAQVTSQEMDDLLEFLNSLTETTELKAPVVPGEGK